jgi:hypothetical protein
MAATAKAAAAAVAIRGRRDNLKMWAFENARNVIN